MLRALRERALRVRILRVQVLRACALRVREHVRCRCSLRVLLLVAACLRVESVRVRRARMLRVRELREQRLLGACRLPRPPPLEFERSRLCMKT